MIQSTTTNQPIYSDNSGLIFNGTTSYLNTSAYTATLNTPSFTIISSATNLNNGSYGVIISSRQDSPTKGYTLYKLDSNTWYVQFGTGGGAGSWGNLLTNITATIGNRFILGFNQSKTTNTITSTIKNTSTTVVNTMSVTSTTYTPASNIISTRIGAGTTEQLPQFFFNGYINDIFYFGVSISGAQQTNVSNLL
jgi:hypothetical protein